MHPIFKMKAKSINILTLKIAKKKSRELEILEHGKQISMRTLISKPKTAYKRIKRWRSETGDE
jgi:hypothetical protein